MTPGAMTSRGASGADSMLAKALARTFRWRRMLETGCFGTIEDFAAAEKINPSHVSRLLRLTLLAPDIVEAILDGRQREGMALPGLISPSLPNGQSGPPKFRPSCPKPQRKLRPVNPAEP